MILGDLAQVGIVAGYEVRKYLRGRRLPGMLILLAMIVGLIVGLPPALGVAYPTEPNAFAAQFATFAGVLVLLCGVLFAADSLCSEHEKRTGYFLFPNPVTRGTIVAGKLVAGLAASASVVTLFYLAAVVSSLVVTGGITVEMGLSYLYALVYMTSVTGIAFIVSSALKTTISATLLTFFLFFLVFNIVQGVLLATDIDPWFLPTAASGIIGNVLAPPPSIPGPGGGGFLNYVPEVPLSIAVLVTYFVAGAVVSVVLFRRRELIS